MEREFLLRQSSYFCNPPTIRFIFFIILIGTFSALGLFLIRGRESVSPNRVDEMRNHRGPPYSIRRQVRMSCSCLSFLSLSLSLSLSRPAHPPSLLSFSLILRWIRRCPVHWHLSKDSDFSLRTWQLRARGAQEDSLPPQLAAVVALSLSLFLFFFSYFVIKISVTWTRER